MAVFPSWVMFNPREVVDEPAPVVLRSEMERGVAKQRRFAADAVSTLQLPAIFSSLQRAQDFEAWYDREGYAWFDFTHPFTGVVVEARIVGGLGALRPLGGLPRSRFARPLQIEYVKSSAP